MKDVILLGGNKLNSGVLKKSKLLGADRVIIFDWNEEPALKGDIHIKLDVKDTDNILKKIDELNVRDLLFCYTSIDLAVKTQIAIHKKFGLLHPNNFAVECTMKKSNMTRIWQEKGLLNRFSYIIKDVYDVFNKCKDNDCIIKPNISSGSRGITILKKDSKLDEIKAAIEYAKKNSVDNNTVVEKFIIGQEYTVEMLGDNYGNVSVWGISKKYHTQYNIQNKIAVKLHYNAKDVAEDLIKRITEHAIKCYKSLGLTNSFGHLELMVSEDGIISPLEIGARSSGYISSDLLDAINYEFYLEVYSRVLRGASIYNGYTRKKEISSMYYFYDIPPRKSVDVCNLLDFTEKEICSVDYDRSKLTANKQFNIINGDHERFGYEILIGPKDILTIDNIEKSEKKFLNKFMGE